MGFKEAYYRGIPIMFNEETNEIRTSNFILDWLVDFNLWFDTEIVGVEFYPIKVKD